MSHLVTIPAQFNDLLTLKAAVEALGLKFNTGEKKMRWYGTFMNDYSGADAAYRQGIPVEDYGKAIHTFDVEGSEYNVGIIQDKDGNYRVYWDSWGRNGKKICDAIGTHAEKLKHEYGKQTAIKYAKSKGYDYSIQTLPNGTTTIKVQTR